MNNAKVKIYQSKTPQGKADLLKLTNDEMVKPGFPREVNVLIGHSENTLFVISIEPPGARWNWKRNFKPFRVASGTFSCRL